MHPKIIAAAAALKEDRKNEAADLLMAALSDEQSGARQAFSVLLHILLEQRRAGEGVTWSGRSIKIFPNDYEFINLHGSFLSMSGRHAEALRMFDRAIRLRPKEMAAQVNKGHCLNEQGNGTAAEQIFTKLVRQQPRSPALLRALARALSHQQKFDAAERRLRQALALNGEDVDAWLDLSALASDRADRTGALEILARAVETQPEEPRLSHARAVMLRHAGQNQEAATFLREILDRFRKEPWLHHELGRALAAADPATATIHHRKAVDLAPANRDYRLALAEHLMRTPGTIEGQHLDDAMGVLEACPPPPRLELIDSKVRTQLLTRVAAFEEASAVGTFADLGRLWARSGLHTALLDQLARIEGDDDRRELIAQHRIWGGRAIERARLNPVKRSLAPKQTSRIRLGFMSSDLRDHPVAYFAWPLFEHADRDRFEIYCYSFYRGGDVSPLQRKLSTMVDQFRWAPSISDRDAAQMIADDQLDMLLELGGSTYMNKLEVMAWKPARLCASWLGYPHSAGLSTIDYLLLDPYLNPSDPSLLIERPLIMPRSWIAMSEQAFPDHHVIEPVAPVRRNGHVTFGTANNPYKYNSGMLRAWARVMARVPNSRFIFVRPECGSQAFAKNIRARFEAEGVSGDRIEFRAVRGKHIPHYNDMDIALDTFPQNGSTTTCEALWMGVPNVTLVGEAMFERLGYTILMNIGLGDLCARSHDEFIDIAVALASDPDRIQALRTGLRDRIRASPLGQPRQFAQDFYDLIAKAVTTEGGTAALPQFIQPS